MPLPHENDLSGKIKSFTVSYYAIRETRIGDYRGWETPISIDNFRIMHRIDAADCDLLHITFDSNDWWNCIYYPQYSITANLNMFTVTVEIGNGDTVVNYYLNNQLVGTKNLGYELVYAADNLSFSVGSQAAADEWYYFEGGCFTGVVDEVRVWDSVLTAEQIAKVFMTDNPDGVTKGYDTVFDISFEIPDDPIVDDTTEETEPADDTEGTTNGDSETEEKPAVTTAPDNTDSDTKEGGLSTTVIVIIVVAAVLVIVAVILGVIASKKK